MAEVKPLATLRYDPAAVGSLEAVIAPPYDVIDAELRARAAGAEPVQRGGDRPARGARRRRPLRSTRTRRSRPGASRAVIVASESEPAFWALEQDYTAPDGSPRSAGAASSRACASRTTGPGRIRPHERTHPGPKEDRLRLTRATRANLSPIFSLFPDPERPRRRGRSRPWPAGEPFARADDHEGTQNTLWRVADPDAVAALESALADAELLIADGHHRYETARVYAEEVGGEGEHRYVLMFLCSLSRPGPDGLPHPPAAHRPQGRPRQAGGHPRDADARLRGRAGLARRARARAGDERARAAGLHGLLPQAALPR